MDADYDIFEIVAVIRDFWLVDAESYQRSYCTHHGQPLTPGYYVVNWPEHIRSRRFNEHATFMDRSNYARKRKRPRTACTSSGGAFWRCLPRHRLLPFPIPAEWK